MPKFKQRTWTDFIEKLATHLGSHRRAQTNFCENSDYSLSSLQHWRKINRVPEEAFLAIEKIDPAKCPQSNFSGYHSSKFTQRVITMSVKNHTLSDIARTLSVEFGRNVTENMIKGIRYRNKDEIASYQSREKQA